MTYQSAPGLDGVFPTDDWFRALMAGVDGPLGSVLDVGCAEGVMSVLAAQAGASSVVGIDTNPERIEIARRLSGHLPVTFAVADAISLHSQPVTTVILSMIGHWIGRDETQRLAKLAKRHVLVVFRERNDHYEVPANGMWFPTLSELDEVVGGIRTHEEVLLTQDNGKRIIAATYRTDMAIVDGLVHKAHSVTPLREGHDLHGDPPFRPTHGAALAVLTPDEQEKVRDLVGAIAWHSLMTGRYPTDLSPRNIIVGPQGAFLVDLDEIEPTDGFVDPAYLPIWQRTLSTVGIEFTGDLRTLL